MTENITVLHVGESLYEKIARFEFKNDIRYILLSINIAIALMGITTNIFNLIVFAKLGFKESINISLFGLAGADLGVCFTTLVCNVGELPIVVDYFFHTFKINTTEVVYVSFTLLHGHFISITMLHTASVSFERCLCVTIPLKVKHIFTPGRVKLMVILWYVVGAINAILTYSINRLGYKFYPELNMTLLGYTVTENHDLVNTWLTPLYILFFIVFLFSIIVVSTILLITNLKKNMSWRSNLKTTSNDPSNKEKRVVKLVAIISSLFVICYLPHISMFIPLVFLPGFSLDGELSQMVYLIGYLIFALETINSSVNMFVYYGNSSAYKDMFLKIFNNKIPEQDRKMMGKKS